MLLLAREEIHLSHNEGVAIGREKGGKSKRICLENETDVERGDIIFITALGPADHTQICPAHPANPHPGGLGQRKVSTMFCS